jgi:DNA polymerase III subunit delta'
MAFAQIISEIPTLDILRKSIERKRVGHAYLFTGANRETLERAATAFAKAVNCVHPADANDPSHHQAADFCDQCQVCERIEEGHHGDVQWIRPESKMRIITMTQMRQLMETLHLKPNDARTKVWMITDADRMNQQSANAFLKTLEEPPGNSLMILLTSQPERLLDTIRSRCLRLNFPGDQSSAMQNEHQTWLGTFAQQLMAQGAGMLDRYKALDILLAKLTEARQSIEGVLKERFLGDLPHDAEPKMREKRELELKAAVEAEYRRRRAEVFTALEWWLRDAWLLSLRAEASSLTFPHLQQVTHALATRVDANRMLENIRMVEKLQRVLHTNVQEALALEVHLLKLNL